MCIDLVPVTMLCRQNNICGQRFSSDKTMVLAMGLVLARDLAQAEKKYGNVRRFWCS